MTGGRVALSFLASIGACLLAAAAALLLVTGEGAGSMVLRPLMP